MFVRSKQSDVYKSYKYGLFEIKPKEQKLLLGPTQIFPDIDYYNGKIVKRPGYATFIKRNR